MDNSKSGLPADRDAAGRFLPGRSGNPAGKKPGTRNRATEIRAMLAAGEEMAVGRTVIDKAISGDAVAARFLLGLLCPRPRSRGRAITLTLPDGAGAGDTVAAFNAALQAMAAGEITPDEALTVTRMLDGRREALTAFKLQCELTRFHGDFILGDELFRPEDQRFREPGEVVAEEDVDEDETDTRTEPSPPGRGQGEGGCRASVVEDERVARDPHPNPLPEGEGMVPSEAAPNLPVSEPPDDHLHSACIEQDLQALSAARQAAERKLAQWSHLMVTQPGFDAEAFIADEVRRSVASTRQRSDALRRSSAALPGQRSRSPSSLNGVSTVLR